MILPFFQKLEFLGSYNYVYFKNKIFNLFESQYKGLRHFHHDMHVMDCVSNFLFKVIVMIIKIFDL